MFINSLMRNRARARRGHSKQTGLTTTNNNRQQTTIITHHSSQTQVTSNIKHHHNDTHFNTIRYYGGTDIATLA